MLRFNYALEIGLRDIGNADGVLTERVASVDAINVKRESLLRTVTQLQGRRAAKYP